MKNKLRKNFILYGGVSMSMIGNFFRTDNKTVQEIQKGELFLFDLVYDENGIIDDDSILTIDKAWHAIHFALSGVVWDCDSTNDPLSKVVVSGNFVNDEDMGYGPAMFVTDKEVYDINSSLKMISKDWFRAKFSVSDMLANEIYSVAEDEDADEDEFFDYIYSYLEQVIAFFEKAANNNQYILFFIN